METLLRLKMAGEGSDDWEQLSGVQPAGLGKREGKLLEAKTRRILGSGDILEEEIGPHTPKEEREEKERGFGGRDRTREKGRQRMCTQSTHTDRCRGILI